MPSKWIRVSTRHGLERRDGDACVYCLGPAESLDHVIPRNRGGTNDKRNLVCACLRCNQDKSDDSLAAFLRRVSARTGEPVEAIARRVRRCRNRKIPSLPVQCQNVPSVCVVD